MGEDKSVDSKVAVETKLTIKETQEAIHALVFLGIVGAAVLEEGLEAEDLGDLLAGAKRYKAVMEGLKGLKGVIPEMKDLDMLEAAQLMEQLKQGVLDVTAASKGASAESLLKKYDEVRPT